MRWQHSPQLFERLADRRLLVIDDPLVAASQFNWLIMSDAFEPGHAVGRRERFQSRQSFVGMQPKAYVYSSQPMAEND